VPENNPTSDPFPTKVPLPPKVVKPTTSYGGIIVRYAASLIDSIIFGIPSSAATYAIKQAIKSASAGGNFVTEVLPNIIGGIFILPLIVYMVKSKGATPGKMFFNLRIVDYKGNIPVMRQVLLREVLGKSVIVLLTLGTVSIVNFFMIAFSAKKQAVHDRMAGTYVLLIKPLSGFKKFVIAVLTLILPLAIIFLVVVIMLLAADPAARISQAKDMERKTDIGSIATAIQTYETQNKSLPSSLQELVESGDLAILPADPDGLPYFYDVDKSGTSAALYANLEREDGVWCWRSESGEAKATDAAQCVP
jgi:uncharacterized RDD family membrane protein YckC